MSLAQDEAYVVSRCPSLHGRKVWATVASDLGIAYIVNKAHLQEQGTTQPPFVAVTVTSDLIHSFSFTQFQCHLLHLGNALQVTFK